MRSSAPALFPVFRSQAQAQVLASVLLNPERELTTTEIARQLNLSLTTVSDEVRRLIESGIFLSRKIGRSKLVRANVDMPAVRSLTEMVMLTMGPKQVMAEEFSDLSAVRELLIFGSWAARYRGEPGPPPHDIDVLVVGRVDRSDAYAAAQRAEKRLGVPVNPVLSSSARWEDGSDALIAQIKSGPVVDIRDLTP